MDRYIKEFLEIRLDPDSPRVLLFLVLQRCCNYQGEMSRRHD